MRNPGPTVSSQAGPALLCLLGPTAAGKTTLAISLAQQIHAEIVSVDSKQIYRFMDIGTAKPTAAQRRLVPHHVIDCINPDDPFSVADFQRLADQAIADIQSRGKRVLVVGGAGLYFRALVDGIFEAPAISAEVRERLRAQLALYGNGHMYRRLTDVDPAAAARIHVNDALRILRALEVHEQTGIPISEHQKQWSQEIPRYIFHGFVLNRSREELYERINRRVDDMLRNGWLREVESLLANGYSRDLVSMDSFGYRELAQHLHDELALDEAAELIRRNTRRFAKRQLTWYRSDPRLQWLDLSLLSEESAIRRILEVTESNS